MLSPIMMRPKSRPTKTVSNSDALRLKYIQMSSVNSELELLYCDVRELMRAASMAASMRPRIP